MQPSPKTDPADSLVKRRDIAVAVRKELTDAFGNDMEKPMPETCPYTIMGIVYSAIKNIPYYEGITPVKIPSSDVAQQAKKSIGHNRFSSSEESRFVEGFIAARSTPSETELAFIEVMEALKTCFAISRHESSITEATLIQSTITKYSHLLNPSSADAGK